MKAIDLLVKIFFQPLLLYKPKEMSLLDWFSYLFEVDDVFLNTYKVKSPFQPPGLEKVDKSWQNFVRQGGQSKKIYRLIQNRPRFKIGEIIYTREDTKRNIYELESTRLLQYGIQRPNYILNKNEFELIKQYLEKLNDKST